MRKRIFSISIAVCFNMPLHSQQIFTDISKYDLQKIESQAIKKHRKLLDTDKERNLTALVYYAINISDGFSPGHCTVNDLLNSMSLFDKYRCFVYDDSISTLSTTIEKSLLLEPTNPTNI